MSETAAPLRSIVAHTAGGLEVVIPALNAWMAPLTVAWMAAIVAIAWLARADPANPALLTGAITLVAAAAVPFGLYQLVWFTKGCEIVHLDGRTLSIERRPLGGSRAYDWSRVRDLRVCPRRYRIPMHGGIFFNIDGTIAFDYEGRRVQFGIRLENAEAAGLIGEMKRRYP